MRAVLTKAVGIPLGMAFLAAIAAIGLSFSCFAGDKSKTPTPGALQVDETPAPLNAQKPLDEDERDRKEALTLFAAGRAMELADKFAPALKNYARALRLDPASSEIVREIVPLAMRLDRESLAVRYALLAIEMDPSPDPQLLRQLGIVQLQKDDWASAMRMFERVKEIRSSMEDADGVLLRLELGRMYFLEEKFEEASDCFAEASLALAKPEKYGLDEKTLKAILEQPKDLYEVFGEAFLRCGRLEEAKTAFEKADTYSPDKGVLNYELAEILAKDDKPKEALALLEIAFKEKLSERGTGPYELLAELLKDEGKSEELVPRLEKMRSADEENSALGYFLAAQYEDSGAFEKAGSIYEELLKKTPTFTGYRGLVSCDLHLKKFDALLATLGEAQDKAGIIEALGDDVTKIVKDGDALKKLFEISRKRAAANPEALTRGESFAAGVLASEAKDWTVAEEFFTYAVKADPPTCGETYLVWGLGLLLDERPADAAKVFERAIEHSANRLELASFHFYLSGALAMDNRIDDALAAAREAAKLKPESTTYLARPGWVLTAGKRYEAACDFYRELMKKLETDFSSEELREGLKEIRLACSGVCVMLGRNDEAEQQLDLVLDEYPEDPGAMNDLGYLWADRNEHLGRASRMLHKAVEAEPENASFRDSLGWLFYRQGKYAEAATELQKALEKQQDGAIYDHLGDVYEKLGEKAKAKEHWQNASKAYEKEKDEEKRKSVEKKLGSVRK